MVNPRQHTLIEKYSLTTSAFCLVCAQANIFANIYSCESAVGFLIQKLKINKCK